jgi:hypothetical protein
VLPATFGNNFTNTQTIATRWIHQFDLLVNGDQNAPSCLREDCCLRDLLVFSPTFRMLEGREKVIAHLLAETKRFYNFRLMGQVTFKAITGKLHLIQGRIQFEDDSASYTAVFTLASTEDCAWACWALFTVLNEIKNIENDLAARVRADGIDFDAIVVGAGQAGLATAAQLQRLGRSVCVIERNSRVGAPWRDRYESLQFNTPKDFSSFISLDAKARLTGYSSGHLPFFPFPDDWPMFPSAISVADHLEKYPRLLGLDIRTSTAVVRTAYNVESKSWNIFLTGPDGVRFILRSRHLVIATGVDILGGLKPKVPQLSGLVRRHLPYP